MRIVIAALLFVIACARDGRSTGPSPTTAAPAPAVEVRVPPAEDQPALSYDVDPGAPSPVPVREAIAVLHPTRGHQAEGVVRFVETAGRGVEVFAVVDGLTASPHAFHVHVYGDCSAPDASSAGPHFHFTGSSFDEEAGIITGNLGELARQPTGPSSTHQALIPEASLQGEFSILGRAVVVHERGNDPAVTPDGDAGARIACGVIGVANPRPPQAARR